MANCLRRESGVLCASKHCRAFRSSVGEGIALSTDPLLSSDTGTRSALSQARSLVELVGGEVDGESTSETDTFVAEIRRRHGNCVRAVLYYGSCLRKGEAAEGVLDFYAIVDSYSAAYSRRLLALTNAWLPPNVYYVELDRGGRTLRAKYNIVSAADFTRCARGRSLHAIVWGRFSQPFRILYSRDAEARAHIVAAAADAIRTMIALAYELEKPTTVSPAETQQLGRRLWSRGLRETYGTELRTESAETIDALYDAATERYDRACELALEEIVHGGSVRAPSVWPLRKRAAKTVYFFRLLKSAWTFGDWLPYALWKFERHTGKHIELTQAQRDHPLIFGWPVIVRILRDRQLH
jgi:hypothetical protein